VAAPGDPVEAPHAGKRQAYSGHAAGYDRHSQSKPTAYVRLFTRRRTLTCLAFRTTLFSGGPSISSISLRPTSFVSHL
jgi:hypothetical protein